MLVFAFDRDWTVDVNPRPDHEAVPLEWVRHLAHETEHAVYAIGNQTLAEEAAIPGVVDIVGRHSDDWNQWLGKKGSDGYYEQFPTRRERLALIADLHPEADGYVVVDDIDLSDVDGWHHYHAWEFVPAVEQGDIDSDLPWVKRPGTDGDLTDLGDEQQAVGVPAGEDPLSDSVVNLLSDSSTDRVFEILRARHRRLVLLLLNSGLIETKRDVLAQDGFDDETDEMALIHSHLPKLAESGYVRWDRSTGQISKGRCFGEVEPFLNLISTHAGELSTEIPAE